MRSLADLETFVRERIKGGRSASLIVREAIARGVDPALVRDAIARVVAVASAEVVAAIEARRRPSPAAARPRRTPARYHGGQAPSSGATRGDGRVVQPVRRRPHKPEIAGSSPAPAPRSPPEAPPLQAPATAPHADGAAAEGPEVLQGTGRRRSKTVSLKTIAHEARRTPVDPTLAPFIADLDRTRPKHRAECEALPRPCPFLACRHHLFLDVNPSTGSIKFNFPGKEPWEIGETCALDVADRGGVTLEEVGSIMNITRERVRQMETRGLQRVRVIAGDDLEQAAG